MLIKKDILNPEQLYQKAREVFEGELPEGLLLLYTTMNEDDSKFYKTWDNKHLIRVHKYFFVWEIQKSALNGFRLTMLWPLLSNDPPGYKYETALEQGRKWLKNYLLPIMKEFNWLI